MMAQDAAQGAAPIPLKVAAEAMAAIWDEQARKRDNSVQPDTMAANLLAGESSALRRCARELRGLLEGYA